MQWQKLQNLSGPLKIKHFVQHFLHQALQVQCALQNKGLHNIASYVWCGQFKSFQHLFLEFYYIRAIWFGSKLGIQPVFQPSMNLIEWF